MKVVGTVAQTFAVSGRGIGVLFVDSPDHVSEIPGLDVVGARPDGTFARFTASREFALLHHNSPDGEVVALMVLGAGVQDIPVGSIISTSAGAAI